MASTKSTKMSQQKALYLDTVEKVLSGMNKIVIDNKKWRKHVAALASWRYLAIR